MKRYSAETREWAIKQMMPPFNRAVIELSGATGITTVTLHTWRRNARNAGEFMPGNGKTSDQWSSADKFRVVLETAPLSEQEIAQYCRSKGIYPEQIAACRGDSGNRHQINELVRSVYMAYYLQRMGFGEVPFECYAHAEAAFENALAVAAKCAKWIISEQDAPVIERLLALHDWQLSEAPMHRVVKAEQLLREFLAGTGASPFVRRTSD